MIAPLRTDAFPDGSVHAAAPAEPRPRSQTAAATTATMPSPLFLRLSAGFVYFYFGFLKLFPDLSPAELLAGETITRLTGHWLSAADALFWLALMEVAIGLSFLFNCKLHWVFPVFVFHQASTFLPLVIVPELCFKFAPFAPTMEGQYILKNLVSMAAGFTVLYPAVRAYWGAHLVAWRDRFTNRGARPALGAER